MAKTLYMVIEHFKGGDAVPVYRRFRDRGRLAPEGLSYVSSWVDVTFERCYQLMETENGLLLDEWIANWSDIVDCEVHPVISSIEAAENCTPFVRCGRRARLRGASAQGHRACMWVSARVSLSDESRREADDFA